MTKFEWERNLKKNLYSLTEYEQKKIFDYYNELFADKIEYGMSEERIIAEFGNPYDVAYRILNESNSTGFAERAPYERGSYAPPYEQQQKSRSSYEQTAPRPEQRMSRNFEEPKKRREGTPWVLGLLRFCLGFFFVLCVYIPIVCIVIAGFVTSIAGQLAGLATIVYSFFTYTIGSGIFFSMIGMGVAGIGVGMFMWGLSIALYRLGKTIVKAILGIKKKREVVA